MFLRFFKRFSAFAEDVGYYEWLGGIDIKLIVITYSNIEIESGFINISRHLPLTDKRSQGNTFWLVRISIA
ncbi:hypothetical protein BZJ18_03725 [Salinivibrio sp. IB872]|nr:hypothetical protein BZJ18_03725 [Salinivibrio sp. IB872]